MIRPTVIGPDGKKLCIPIGMVPKMERNTHGVMICKGFETQVEAQTRERQNKIQRLRDAPDANQWMGQMKIKAFETGSDALLLMSKETTTLMESLKQKYPGKRLPTFPEYPPNEVEYDTRLVRQHSYMRQLQQWDMEQVEADRKTEESRLKSIAIQHVEHTRQVEHMKHIEALKAEFLPIIAAKLELSVDKVSAMLSHIGYTYFPKNKLLVYQTINQYGLDNHLTSKQAYEILCDSIEKEVRHIFMTTDDNAKKLLLCDLFATENTYMKCFITSLKLGLRRHVGRTDPVTVRLEDTGGGGR